VAQASEMVPNEIYTIDLSKMKIIVALLFSNPSSSSDLEMVCKIPSPLSNSKQFSMFLLLHQIHPPRHLQRHTIHPIQRLYASLGKHKLMGPQNIVQINIFER
jgi:hypothetical protein